MEKKDLNIQKGSMIIRNRFMFIGFFSWQMISCQHADLHFRKRMVSSEKVVKPKHCILEPMMAKSVGQEGFRRLLKNMVDLSVRYEGSKNLLDVAVDSGDVEKVRAILEVFFEKQGLLERSHNNSFPNSKNPHTQLTPLGLAIEKGYVDIVKLLVNFIRKDDVGNYKKENGVIIPNTPSLLLALSVKNEAVALALLAHMDGVRLNMTAKDAAGNTPLHLAIKYGFKRLSSVLIQKLSLEDLYIKNNKASMPLHMAIRYNQKEIFKPLFDRIKHSSDAVVFMKYFKLNEEALTSYVKCAHVDQVPNIEPSLFAYAYLLQSSYSKCVNRIPLCHNKNMFGFMLKVFREQLRQNHIIALFREISYHEEKKSISKPHATLLRRTLHTSIPKDKLVGINGKTIYLIDEKTTAA